MDKFKTIAVGGLGLTLDDFRWFFGRLTAPSEGIYQAFNNLLRGFGDNFIVQGCVLGGVSGAFTLTEGWIMLDGELIKVDAQPAFNEASPDFDNTFVKVTTFNERGTKTFLNGSINETYESNRAVIQGTSGNLDFDDNTFSDLRTIADVSGTDTPIKKKVINIGSWNMDTIATLDVAHGLSDITKIRTISVIIQDDTTTTIHVLGNKLVNASSPAIEGGINVVTTTNIQLKRTTGGIFDGVLFDDGGINRGWITIEFVQ